ncbi:Protein of unknown function [Bacillus mycoides]|nr:Protein of unknown function [Bacillus mycoides]
MNKVSLIVPIL